MGKILHSVLAVPLAFGGWAAAAASPSSLLKFDLKPKEITERCQAAQERSDERLKALVEIDAGSRDFNNTALAFESTVQEYSDAISGLAFLKYVSTDPAVRDASHQCEVQAEQYTVEVYTREDVYRALKTYSDKKPALEGEDAKLLDKIMLAFKRNGLGLAPEKRSEVKRLKKRVVDLELTFGKNLNEYKDFLDVTQEQLAGLPESFVQHLEKTPEGRFIVSLDYPDFFPFMENARDPEARRHLEFKYNNRASATNARLLEEAIGLRHQIARLLGYPTHAHYVLEDRMAKKPDRVMDFLHRLRAKLKPKGLQELKERLELKERESGRANARRLFAWDRLYYNNQLKKLKYQIDQEKIREYFPLETVMEGMLGVYQRLLGLRYPKIDDGAKWHPDVELYEVRDAQTEELIGHFYMDLFPREGKYKHAAAFPVVKGHLLPDGGYQKPVSAIVANLSKPTSDRPSLLKHDEVETLFHEFGHIMHQVLTRAKYGRFSGTSVTADFVEAASQMLENWVWNQEVLKSLSGHYQDKSRKLPDDLLKKMIDAKNMDSGLSYLRQVFFAVLDMEYHTRPKADTTSLYAKLMEKITLIPMNPGTHPQASFGHLMGGYDAGYYGYLWSEVYSADMFSRFEKEGILNPELGTLYRQLILEPGGSLDEDGQLKKFLGRPPNEQAFLRSIGVQ